MSCSCTFETTLSQIHIMEVDSEWLDTCLPKSYQIVTSFKGEILKAYDWKDYISVRPKKVYYRSIMDMILCNIYPFHKSECKAYYANRGKI